MKGIFDEARRLASDAQEAFVRERCAGDAGLAAQVMALLKDLRSAGAFMDSLAASSAMKLEGFGTHEGPGSTIGRFKLLQLIGEGGFGSVFLAEQREPVRRTVALKIIKLGMDTRQVIARFEQERQALALMDHPNIARVLDAGATETGRPYFVMEFVRGEPITLYCDDHKLGMKQRLEVFAQVCHAVQHAHQKGIIHRDLKPSNILVTVADDRPVPKIIDFGIAKATGPRLTDKTLFTEHRALIGTPEYMSPEQAEMGSADVDTRSDIYALGVLLYELMTGVTPFDPERLRSASWVELQRIIREVEPPRPSARLSAMAERLPEIAARREAQPGRLRGLIRGDLDWMVMKCLEKDRTRRYATADELAADIQRHLTGQPVSAAPPSTAYRVRKFVRRNRAAVAAVSLVTAVGLIGLVGTSAGLLIARGQRDRAIGAEKRERQRATEAEDQAQRAKVALAILDLGLGFADPASPGGKHLEVREMLRLAEKSISTRFPRLDEQMQARVTFGQRLLRIDESLAADEEERKAIRLLKEYGTDPRLIAEAPRLMFEARSVLSGCASAGVHDYPLVERQLTVEAAVEYLRNANPALGAAAAEYAERTMWTSLEPQDPARIERAGRSLLAAADGFSEMTSAQASALTAVLHVPCLESTDPGMAQACGPILLKWLGTAEERGVDENTMMDYRHTVLKLYAITDRCNEVVSVAQDQLRATEQLLPSKPWQRLRYDSCAARTLAFAGQDTDRARQILINAAEEARASQSQNKLAARVLLHHLFAVAAKTPPDPDLVTEALGPLSPALVEALLEVRDFGAWTPERLRRFFELASAQPVLDPGTRRVLGAAMMGTTTPIFSSMPDGASVLERLVDFLKPDQETPTAIYAQALFELAKRQSELGQWEEARGTYERGVDCYAAVFEDDDWFRARGRFLIGNCQAVLGDSAKGLAAMRENLQWIRDRMGPDHPETLTMEYGYYARLLDCGDRREASVLLGKILTDLRGAPPRVWDYAWPLLRMASLQPDLDPSAIEDVSQLAHLAVARSPNSEALLTELLMLLKQNKQADASALACEQLGTALRASPPRLEAVNPLAWGVAQVRGLGPQAYELLEKCVAMIPGDEQLLRSMTALRNGRYDDALKLARESDKEWIQKSGRGFPDSAAVRACALAHLKSWDEARSNLRDAQTWARDQVYAVPLIAEARDLIASP
jgi:serine/threonine protein kinase/tetratricopeptide (TPR) repeat protein